MWVRRVRCHVCGAPKVTSSRTAHDHCSYCGTFTDWNHEVAYATAGSHQPGPRYQALRVYLQPEIEEARRRGHLPQLAAAFRQLYEVHVDDCPAAYSPRVSDASYRKHIVDYHALRDAARMVDARARSLESEMERAARTMFYVDRPEGRFVRPDRFFAVLDAFGPLQARLDELLRESGAIEVHPDVPPVTLLHKVGQSAFVQAWMPSLDRDTGLRALEATGLSDHYEEVPSVRISEHGCPSCSAAVAVPDGARAVLCECCGTLLGGGGGVMRCSGCGGGFTFDEASREVACPYCRRVTPRS